MSSDATYPLVGPPEPAVGIGARDRDLDRGRSRWTSIVLTDLALLACVLHGLAIWSAIGGRDGLENGWPLWRDDHPLYFHSALVTRDFLKQTWTTAGYDPAFMAGYAKSIVFPASSTLPELVVFAFGGDRPEYAYKLYVLASAAVVPWLVLLAARMFGAGSGGALVAVVVFVAYVWTDFPINYAAYGMLPYLLAVPLGLVATATVGAYVERGGLARCLAAGLASSLCVLVHFTVAMMVVPAAASIYVAGVVRARRAGGVFSKTRHLGVWLIPALVLGLNAFWWLPGLYLATTKGPSDFVFAHPEPVVERLATIFAAEPMMESVCLGMGLLGLATAASRRSVRGLGLAVFAASGGFWGYLAGGFRSLDFLQPGRHTYAFYSALAVAGGLGWTDVCRRLSATRPGRLDLWASAALAILGLRVVAPAVDLSVCAQIGRSSTFFRQVFPNALRAPNTPPRSEPFLSSRPSPRLLWVVEKVKEHVRPGERLLYEEGGFAVPDEPDPYDGGRFSGLLPWRCGVEVLGGPYLHAALTTNFTQFGEGKLFGRSDWDRAYFVEYATAYRPAAILCWTARSRSFCRANPDLVEIKADDGRLMIGRLKGFEGAALRGSAIVEAGPNRLTVRDVRPGVDGLAVLRYHSVPCLRSHPEGVWEPVSIAGDPVPFIGVRSTDRPIEFELSMPVKTTGGPR